MEGRRQGAEQIEPIQIGQRRPEATSGSRPIPTRTSGASRASTRARSARPTSRCQSGRAIEARQRQAVSRSRCTWTTSSAPSIWSARATCSIVQNYYTEQRIYRLTGDDGKKAPIMINQMMQDPISGGKRIINDVTIGKYAVAVDERRCRPPSRRRSSKR
jgi:hypothetical protein